MSVSFWPFLGLVEAQSGNGPDGRPSSSDRGELEPGLPEKLRRSAAKTLESLVRVTLCARAASGRWRSWRAPHGLTHLPLAFDDLTAASTKARPLTPSSMVGKWTDLSGFLPTRAALMASAASE
jgi:hypothetical protein